MLRIYGPGERVALKSLDRAIEVDRVYVDVFDVSVASEGA